jgi:ribonuclease P protein component
MDGAEPAPAGGDPVPPPRARPARLKRRGDFLRVAAARRKVATAGFILQAAPNPATRRATPDAAPPPPRVGFTVSRKVGNAVVRNRARRRLRAAVDQVFPAGARPGWDYVLIGRQDTNAQAFVRLLDDLRRALHRIAEDRPRQGGRGQPGRGGRRSDRNPSR